MSILEKTKDLADAIADSQELKDLRSAESRIQLDPDAQDIIQEFQQKQREVYEAQMQGGQLTQDQQDAVKQIEGKMQANESINNYIEAQKKFEQLMQSVNNIISQAISGDSGCASGGCDTCNSCG